jgi:hypothetical protein
MSVEIMNDGGSECFRDLVSQALVEMFGAELQYGSWTVSLRSEREVLYIAVTRPDTTSQEWAVSFSGAQRPAEVAEEVRRRMRWFAHRSG